MTNRVNDTYTVELEALSENGNKPLPVRCIATNTDDRSTSEVWLSREKTRALLNMIWGSDHSAVDCSMQQLEDHHYVDLISEFDETAKPIRRCLVKSEELLPFGFPRGELHPWRSNQRARIVKAVEEEFPNHTVIFDEDSKRDIRFRIEDQLGTIRTNAHPHVHPSIIEDMTDEQLRSWLRGLCGFSH